MSGRKVLRLRWRVTDIGRCLDGMVLLTAGLNVPFILAASDGLVEDITKVAGRADRMKLLGDARLSKCGDDAFDAVGDSNRVDPKVDNPTILCADGFKRDDGR